MHHHPPGTVFELGGIYYVITEKGSNLPNRPEKLIPQPDAISEEYIHRDGKYRICANPRCSNLVPRGKNTGAERKYCSRKCLLTVGRRRYEKRCDALMEPKNRDGLGRLYAVVLHRPKSVKVAREMLYKHLDGLEDRCPEANEDSNFSCPGRFNPNCLSKSTWLKWHQTGPWPGACLIYAAMKDYYQLLFYEAGAQKFERQYTIGRGEQWRWKDEEDMLPLPEGIVRG